MAYTKLDTELYWLYETMMHDLVVMLENYLKL